MQLSLISMEAKLLWMALGFRFKKLWAWIKHNGHVVLVFCVAIMVWVISREGGKNLFKVIENVKQSHQDEIDVMNRSHQDEVDKIKEAQSRAIETMTQIEEKYREARRELDSKQREEAKKILTDYANDPDTLTKRLSELTGFEIYVKP